MTQVWADVLDASYNVLGSGPITTILSAQMTRVLDGPGEVSIQVPLGDARVQDAVDNERRLKLWVYENGAKRTIGIGILRKKQASETASGWVLVPSGPDQLDELRRVNTLLARIYDGDLVSEVVDDLVGLAGGWSADTTGLVLDNNVYARFDGTSVLKSLQEICKQQGLHFRLDADREIALGPLGDAAPVRVIQAGHRVMQEVYENDAVALIDQLTCEEDSEAVANWIIPLGKGQGEAALTLENSTRGADRIESLTTYAESNQDQNAGLQYSGDSPVKTKLAQSFQISSVGWINSARLYLRKVGSPTGTLTLRIETNNSGSPSGTLAHANATTTINEADLDDSQYVMERFTFGTGFYLAASTTYWLVLSTDRAASGSNYVLWGADGTSPGYANGEMKNYAGAWYAESKDACFDVETLIDSRAAREMAEHGVENYNCVVALGHSLDVDDMVLTGGTATASSYQVANPPSEAFDGTSDAWLTLDETTGWLKMDLGAGNAQPLAEYDVVALGVGAVTRTVKTWVVEGSNDDSDYDELDSQEDITFTAGETKTFYIPETLVASYRYYRMTITENGGGAGYTGLAEWALRVPSGGNTALAQSFQVDAAGRISSVKLMLAKHGDGGGGTLYARLYGDSGDEPAGLLDTSNGVAVSTLAASPAMVEFTFGAPAYVAASTTYWLYLYRSVSGQHPTNFLLWGAHRNLYPGGTVPISPATSSGFAIGTFANGIKYWGAQSLKPEPGIVDEITVYLGANTGSPTGTITYELRSGGPAGTLLYRDTFTPTPSDTNTLTLTDGPLIDDGDTVWLVLRPTVSQTTGNHWNWIASDGTSEEYADGYLQQYDDNSKSWSGDGYATQDFRCSITTVSGSEMYGDGEMKSYDGADWSAEEKDAIFSVLAECVVEPYAIQTTTGPDGRTLYYLKHQASITAYGQIEKVFTAEISPVSHSLQDTENAANALYDAAAAWLDRYALKQTSYKVQLKKCTQTIKPGQLVHMTYKGQLTDVDDNVVSWRDINDTFWVIKVSEDLVNGDVDLELSDVDRAREDISALIVGTMEAVTLQNVRVQPYPAVFTYVYTDFIQAAAITGPAPGGGSFTFGKRARFKLVIGSTINQVIKVVMKVKTRPLFVQTVYDTISAAPDLLYDFGVIEDDDYPANISLYINDEDVTAEYGGPWMTGSDQNEEWTDEFDLTDDIIAAGTYGEHTIEFEADERTGSGTIYTNVPGYIDSIEGDDSHGIVEVTFEVHCTTQAIQVG